MYKTVFNKRERFVFTHFGRKGYSLFSCLGREVLIGTLSVATLTYAKADGISTDLDKVDSVAVANEKDVLLDEVDVTASRAPLAGGQAARIVQVLDRAAIAAAPAQSVNDLLKYIAGVDVRQRLPMGAQTDVSVRGGTSEHIVILLNGINICDPQSGHNAFDLPVDLSEIERIEILGGPAGRVYGVSSLVGAINIITQPSKHSGGELRAEGGSFGYASAGGHLSLASKAHWSNQVSGSYSRSDGWLRSKAGHLNTDYEGGKAFYQGRYDDEHLWVGWHAGFTSKGWGSNTSYSPKSDEQYEHTEKYFTALQAQTKQGSFRFRPAIYWNRNIDRYEFFRGNSSKSKFNYNRTDVFGLSLTGWFDWLLGRTAFCADVRNEDLVSGNLGEPLDQPIHIHGTDRDYTLGLNRSNLSFSLEHNVLLDDFTLSAGFTAVKNTWNEMPFKLYPGVDASYRINRSWKVFASYNMSLRMPSFTELYYTKDGHQADKHLKPEEMSAVEGGVKYQGQGISGTLSVYYHHGTNMIDWIMDTSLGEEAVWTSVNHTKINSTGVEAALQADLYRLLPMQRVLRSLHVAYSYIDQDQDREPGIQSLYALEYLRHKLVAGLGVNILPCLQLDVNYRYQYRMGAYTDVEGDYCNYKPYSLVDARLTWDRSKYSVYVEANNIFDADYVDYGNVPQPGAWIMAGAKWKFDF